VIGGIIRYSFHQRFIIALLGTALVGVGIWAFNRLEVEAYPDISDTQTVIVTLYPGHATQEVEQQVTVPIERSLNNTPGIIARRSRTIFGLSVVELTFAYGTNDYFARQAVLERLRDATLPVGVTPELAPLTTPIGELYRYYLVAEHEDLLRLRELEDWVIEPRLLQVSGVADVAPFGGLVKQYQIEVDPMKLYKYGLTINQIAEAVNANNQNAGGALLDNRQQAIVVRGVGLVESTPDIENIVVVESKGAPVFIKDVGRVKIGFAPQTGIFGINEINEAIEGLVLMRRGENPSEVLQGIHEAVEELNSTRLPSGVRLVPIYDRSDLVNNTLHTVSRTLLEGLVIVVTVLLLFLGSARAALLTAVTIPLSLLFAFLCMQLTGIPANLLSLGALDFGIIVDGTLVMVEHIVHLLSLHPRRSESEPVSEIIRGAALEMGRPVFFSLAIIIAAYIPLFTLERVERRLFTPMAFTISYALLGSLLLSLTLIPVLATYLFRHGVREWHNPVFIWLQRRYGSLLAATVRKPFWVVLAAALIVASAFMLGRYLGTEFLPQLDEGVIWIRANLPAGISLSKSAEIAAKIRSIIRQSPEVKLVGSQSGRIDTGMDPFGPNRNELLVLLNPYDTWKRGKAKADLVEELAAKLRAAIPGAAFNFTQPIIDMATEAVTGSSADVAVIIHGPDLDELRRLARRTLAMLQEVRGAADTSIEQEEDQAQLRIVVNRREVARYGINVRDVQDVIELAVGGRAASTLYEGERRFDITVRYVPEARTDPVAIGNILVPTREGARVPLSRLADIRIANGSSIIARRENRREITIRTNVRGRDQGGFVADAQHRFESSVMLPSGYHVEWGGQFENLERARKRLSVILPVTVAIIFALLFITFDSAGLAGLVLLNVPFSLVGGIVALYLRGINLSVSAAVGFVSLFGVAVMGGVLIVSEINRRRVVPGVSLEEAVVSGALAQMRPVLMMIIVALLGMVPAATATGIGSDVQRPLATVVVGGLFSTLFLTLLVLPSLYLLIAKRMGNGHES
jgi:cobalt-zinc-cadmium resistance protein CzcA